MSGIVKPSCLQDIHTHRRSSRALTDVYHLHDMRKELVNVTIA